MAKNIKYSALGLSALTLAISGVVIPANVLAEDAPCSVMNEATPYTDLAGAVQAASAGDKLVVSGVCELTSGIKLEKKLTITGGEGATVKYDAGDTNYAAAFWFGENSGGSKLENLTVEFAGTGSETSAVYFGYENNGGTEAEHTVITGNAFKNTAKYSAIGISTTYNPATKYVDIINNSFDDFKYGMYFNLANNFSIKDNSITNTKYNAINVAGDSTTETSKDIEISGNILKDISSAGYEYPQYSAGIRIGKNVTDTVVTGNNISMLEGCLPVFIESTAETVVFDDSGVAIDGAEANQDVIIKETDVTDGEIAAIDDFGYEDLEVAQAFDIKVMEDDVINPELENEITFEIHIDGVDGPEEGYTREWHLLYFHKGGLKEIEDFTFEDGILIFATKEFSTYLLGYVDTEIEGRNTPVAPETGRMTSEISATVTTILASVMAGIVVAGLSAKYLLRR